MRQIRLIHALTNPESPDSIVAYSFVPTQTLEESKLLNLLKHGPIGGISLLSARSSFHVISACFDEK